MKDEDSFAGRELSPTTSDTERGNESDGHWIPPPAVVPQDVSSPTHPPHMERQLTLRHFGRPLLVVMVLMVVLAGGYGIFRAISPPARQTLSTFQQTQCPFPLGKGLREGKDVRCGFLVVPEDRSHVPGPTIRLAVAIFKTPSSNPASDPVLELGGGPGNALLENQGPTFTADNLASRLMN